VRRETKRGTSVACRDPSPLTRRHSGVGTAGRPRDLGAAGLCGGATRSRSRGVLAVLVIIWHGVKLYDLRPGGSMTLGCRPRFRTRSAEQLLRFADHDDRSRAAVEGLARTIEVAGKVRHRKRERRRFVLVPPRDEFGPIFGSDDRLPSFRARCLREPDRGAGPAPLPHAHHGRFGSVKDRVASDGRAGSEMQTSTWNDRARFDDRVRAVVPSSTRAAGAAMLETAAGAVA